MVGPVMSFSPHVYPSMCESEVGKCPVVTADQAAEGVAVEPNLVLQTDRVPDPRAVVIKPWNILMERPAVFRPKRADLATCVAELPALGSSVECNA